MTDYASQLSEKNARLTSLLSPFTHPSNLNIDIYPSQASHYRQRAEFRVWHHGDDFYHIIFNQ